MSHFLLTAAAAIAVIAVAAPVAAIFLVSVASRREESEHSLSGHAPGAITRAARRLLAYRSQAGHVNTWTAGRQPRPHRRPSSPVSRAPRPAGRPGRRPAEPVTISLAPDSPQDRREPAATRAA